jgi:serine/threonine-protein kinase RsbT
MRTVVVTCQAAEDRTWCATLAFGFGLEAGLSRRAARELSIAVSELVSNLCRHGGGGQLTLRLVTAPRSAVEVMTHDRGPGIVDVKQALTDGWSRGRKLSPNELRDGLGAGLGAVARLMSELEVESSPGGGTTVIARRLLEDEQ